MRGSLGNRHSIVAVGMAILGLDALFVLAGEETIAFVLIASLPVAIILGVLWYRLSPVRVRRNQAGS